MIKPITLPFIEWCRYVVASEREFVVLDTETTGLDGEIIDLAIVDTKGNALYNSLLKPLCVIEEDAQATHHISADMVTSAPTIADEWPRICDIVGGRTVVTYNAKFDSERIAYSLSRHGVNTCSGCTWVYQCAMTGYASFWGAPPRSGKRNAPWQKLELACSQQDITLPPGLHRAMPDVLATVALLCKIAATGEGSPRYGTP